MQSRTTATQVLARVAGAMLALAASACGGSSGPTEPTYYADVQPIIQAKCEGCHTAGGIGPFPLQTAAQVVAQKVLIKGVVTAGTMPPWPPSSSCNTFAADRSLSESQISTISSWIDTGAVVGDAATQKTAPTTVGLSRIDLSVQMPEAFTPVLSPDDYRCFLLDWAPTTEMYVTGFGVRPGDAQIVHHAIAYVAKPDQVAAFQALDAGDGSPGWTCFGGPMGTSTPNASGGGFGGLDTPWLGAWAPGAPGNDFPADTGVMIKPGSKIILQVHYNTSNTAPAPDQTTLDFELSDSVMKPAYVLPFTNGDWVGGHMNIPANAPDTKYAYSVDPTPYLSLLTDGLFEDNMPINAYMSFLHMHTRGSAITGSVIKADGSTQCLLDVPQWNFNWQGGYTFSSPSVVSPGDQLSLECHWNNTAANQPYINGVQVTPHDLNWGETTEDEMCLEILYLTQ